MPRKIILWVGITVVSALILVGVFMIDRITSSIQPEDGVVEVVIKDGKTTSVSFENLCLLPGDQTSYQVKLNRKSQEDYQITLAFIPDGESPLAEFTYVRIERYGEVVYQELLKNAFDQPSLIFNSDFSKDSQDLTVTYYLPMDVGNEAQNTVADFKLQIFASNEKG